VGEERTSAWALALRYAGTPLVALLLGMVVATLSLPRSGRLGRLRELTGRAIERCAVVMMITGAGGGLGGVIKASGVGDQIAGAFEGLALPGLLLPFLMAMALTTATGSLTVAMVTSSAVVAPLLPTLGLSAEMAVALIGAGSLSIIHANSSFFWLLSRLHDVRPDVLYRTYSVQSLCMGLGGLLGVMALRLLGVS
jgi:GntP family gluconate:H+ symporter